MPFALPMYAIDLWPSYTQTRRQILRQFGNKLRRYFPGILGIYFEGRIFNGAFDHLCITNLNENGEGGKQGKSQ